MFLVFFIINHLLPVIADIDKIFENQGDFSQFLRHQNHSFSEPTTIVFSKNVENIIITNKIEVFSSFHIYGENTFVMVELIADNTLFNVEASEFILKGLKFYLKEVGNSEQFLFKLTNVDICMMTDIELLPHNNKGYQILYTENVVQISLINLIFRRVDLMQTLPLIFFKRGIYVHLNKIRLETLNFLKINSASNFSYLFEALDITHMEINNIFINDIVVHESKEIYFFSFEKILKLICINSSFSNISILSTTKEKGSLFKFISNIQSKLMISDLNIFDCRMADSYLFLIESKNLSFDFNNLHIKNITNAWVLQATATANTPSKTNFINPKIIQCTSLRFFSAYNNNFGTVKILNLSIINLKGIIYKPFIECIECSSLLIDSFIIAQNFIELTNGGGFIRFDGTILLITNSVYIANELIGDVASFIVCWKNTSLYLENTIFSENFFIGRSTLILTFNNFLIMISNSLFKKNKMEEFPYLGKFTGNDIIITECVIIENNSNEGTGIDLLGESVCFFILKSTIKYNKANSFTFLIIRNNFAKFKFGVFYYGDLVFTENAGLKELIYIGENKNQIHKFHNCIFDNNSYGILKVFYYVKENSYYNDPKSHNPIKIYQNDCLFLKNQGNKGAIYYFRARRALLIIKKLIFSENYSSSFGGVYYTYSGVYIFSENTFYNRNKAKNGGVSFFNPAFLLELSSVYIFNEANIGSTIVCLDVSKIYLNGVVVNNSLASLKDSIIISDTAKFNITNSRILNCLSKINSAFISVFSFGNVSVSNSYFKSNQGGEGTIIYAVSARLMIFISGCFFQSNQHIGSLFLIESSKLIISKCSFDLNSGPIFLNTDLGHIEMKYLYINDTVCQMKRACILTSQKDSSLIITNVYMETSSVVETQVSSYFELTKTYFMLNHSIFCTRKSQGHSSYKNLEFSNNILMVLDDVEFTAFGVEIECFILSLTNSRINIFLLNAFVCEGWLINKISDKFGGFLNVLDSNINITKSCFSNMSIPAFQVSSNSILNDLTNVITFNYCIFSNVHTQIRSTLFIINTNLIAIGNLFINNKCKTKGGCAQLLCNSQNTTNSSLFPPGSYCIWIFHMNYFIENSADNCGGVIYWNFVSPLVLPPVINYFFNNKASCGNEIASIPVYVDLENNDESLTKSLISGRKLMNVITFRIFDYYDQIVSTLSEGLAKISIKEISNDEKIYLGVKKKQTIIIGDPSSFIVKGSFFFDNIIIKGLPTDESLLLVELKPIPIVNWHLMPYTQLNHTYNESNKYFYATKIKFAPCKAGEIFNSQKSICQECPEDYFQFEPTIHDGICYPCPSNAKCLGSNKIIVFKGYWRENKNSSKIYKCQNIYSCRGGINSSCNEGFGGRLCHTCINYEGKLYYMDLDKTCKPCELAQKLKGAIISVIFVVIFLVYIIILTRKKIKNMQIPGDVLIKILIDYLQVYGIFSTISVKFSENLPQEINFQNTFNDPNFLLIGMECNFGPWFELVNIYYQKLIIICIMSLFIPLILLLIGRIFKCYNKIHHTSFLTLSLFVTFDTLQSLFINFFFSALQCKRIEDDLYLLNFPQEQCWSPSHKFLLLLVIPCLLFWMVIIPFFILLNIRKNRRLRNYLGPYLYFTYGFKDQYFYWDSILMLRKYILILIVTFVLDQVLAQILIISFSYLFFLSHIIFQPYSQKALNTFVVLSYFAFNSFISCSIILTAGSNRSLMIILLFITMVMLNLGFLIGWILFYIKTHPKAIYFWNKICIFQCIKFPVIYARSNPVKLKTNFTDKNSLRHNSISKK